MKKLLLVALAATMASLSIAQGNRILMTMHFEPKGVLDGTASAAGVKNALPLLSMQEVDEQATSATNNPGTITITFKALFGSKPDKQLEKAFQNHQYIANFRIFMIGKGNGGKEVVASAVSYEMAEIVEMKTTVDKETIKLKFTTKGKAVPSGSDSWQTPA